jgi:cupin fold WbuC family metalloprotein
MKQIDNSLLDSLTAKAKDAPRKRAHFNLHQELNNPVQRLCIAMEPETYVRPHRHSDPATWEILFIVRGSLAFLVFDDKGRVLQRTVLTAGGPVMAIEFPQHTWHAPVSLEPGTVVFEVKQGPYKPIEDINLAPWAPTEGTPEAARVSAWYKNAQVGASYALGKGIE